MPLNRNELVRLRRLFGRYHNILQGLETPAQMAQRIIQAPVSTHFEAAERLNDLYEIFGASITDTLVDQVNNDTLAVDSQMLAVVRRLIS